MDGQGVGFAGALIVIRPGIIEITLASAAALLTAFMYAGSNTTIKLLARRDSPEAITLWTNLLMLPLVPASFLWVAPTPEQWPLIVGAGVVSGLGGYCFTRSVSAADARVVQPFQFSRMIFATAVGFAMFSEFPGLLGGIRSDFRRVLVRDPPGRARRILTRARRLVRARFSPLGSPARGNVAAQPSGNGVAGRFPRPAATRAAGRRQAAMPKGRDRPPNLARPPQEWPARPEARRQSGFRPKRSSGDPA